MHQFAIAYSQPTNIQNTSKKRGYFAFMNMQRFSVAKFNFWSAIEVYVTTHQLSLRNDGWVSPKVTHPSISS